MHGSSSGLPFDDIRALVRAMPGPDNAAAAAVAAREAHLVKPAGSLGRLEEIVAWLAAWQGNARPTLDRPQVAVFVTSHGVTARGVSAFPADVSRQMLDTYAAGGGAINQICASFGAGLKVFDVAVDHPTRDIATEAAMEEPACAATMAFGMEAIAGGADLLVVGEMAIGNTTIAAAIYHALYGGRAEDWVGPGTGLGDAGLARKIDTVARAVALHRAHLDDPLEILRRLGGRDIAAMAGAILAARLQRIPVLLDGYVVTAAAAILHAMDASALDHCMAAHRSAEPAHGRVLAHLGKRPLLELDMRLGEATGGALALGIAKAALACHRDMATFEQAGVSGRSD
jgi:nicotinate-nucleotide--dimethylbenzimidazole phosphoribosyltransferase